MIGGVMKLELILAHEVYFRSLNRTDVPDINELN